MPETPRTIVAYSLHGRAGSQIVAYPEFFDSLSRFSTRERTTSVGDELVAITSMQSEGAAWVLRFVSGIEGEPTLYFNPRTGEEEIGAPDGRLVATSIWVLIDPDRRLVITERKRPGVPVSVVARTLSHLSAELGILPRRATFDLNPVIGESFVTELAEFSRIRRATVKVAEPNYSWLDSATPLAQYASESNGRSAEVSVTAGRGESLSTEQGIVSDIKELASNPIGPIQDVKVEGRKAGAAKDSQLSQEKHQIQSSYSVEPLSALDEQREVFREAAQRLLALENRDTSTSDD